MLLNQGAARRSHLWNMTIAGYQIWMQANPSEQPLAKGAAAHTTM
jgi:hypothetical protein